MTFSAKPGWTSCFTVVARDGDGNESSESNMKCTSTPLDDRSLKRSDGWKKGTGNGFYKKTFVKTKRKEASLTLPEVGDTIQLALVATRCPDCGKVKVLMSGDLIGLVSLKGPQKNQHVFKLPVFATKHDTIKSIVVSEGKLVKIDGLGIRRNPNN